MNKEELIKKLAAAIKKMKDNSVKGVIKEHTISPVCNWHTGEENGQAIVLECGTKFNYTEDVLNIWKEQLGASKYYIKVNRSQLFITYIVYY